MLNFIGIGAQKCGTTWLQRTLARHPDIAFPGGKEVHFWDQHYARGLDWYRHLFADNGKLNGDITPAYGFLPLQKIQEARALTPDARLIYLIRNPLERAWSSARMALARAEMTHDEASDQWFIDHFRSRGSLARGDYETCIKNWRSVFPPEQLLVLRFEDIEANPVETANRCLDHIQAAGHRFTQHDQQVLRERQFAGDGIPLRSSLIAPLLNIYADRINSLSDYLQWDLRSWLRPEGSPAVAP